MPWGERWVVWSSCLRGDGLGGMERGLVVERGRNARLEMGGEDFIGGGLYGQGFEIITWFQKEPRKGKQGKKGGGFRKKMELSAPAHPPQGSGCLRAPCSVVAWGCPARSSLHSTLSIERFYFQFLRLCQAESVRGEMLHARNLLKMNLFYLLSEHRGENCSAAFGNKIREMSSV